MKKILRDKTIRHRRVQTLFAGYAQEKYTITG